MAAAVPPGPLKNNTASGSNSLDHHHLAGPGSMGALRSSLQGVLGYIRLGKVAYADAAAPAAVVTDERGAGAGGDATMLSPLEEGEKPEFIQRADEQVCSS